MTPDDNSRAANESKRLEDKAKADKAAEEKKRAAGDGEVHIQQGFSDADPVELEAEEGAEVSVDVDSNLESAPAVDIATMGTDAPAPTAPSRKASKSGSRRRR